MLLGGNILKVYPLHLLPLYLSLLELKKFPLFLLKHIVAQSYQLLVGQTFLIVQIVTFTFQLLNLVLKSLLLLFHLDSQMAKLAFEALLELLRNFRYYSSLLNHGLLPL